MSGAEVTSRRGKADSRLVQTMVSMAGVSSAEGIVREGGEPRRVLSDITLRVERAQSWGITARTAYEIRLLLEIIGNIRPYDGGKCVLAERGMLRRKRVIQPHVFYIGGTDMLYGSMNVLEFLMFATARLREEKLSMQENLFEFLIAIGLSDISLTAVKWLSAEEKAVVTLIAAAYSASAMIVFNLPEAAFDARLRSAIAQTATLIMRRGKALILGTLDCALIDEACTHTAFIADGRMLYQGTAEALKQEYDRCVLILDDADIEDLRRKLDAVLDGSGLSAKDGCLRVTASDDAQTPALYRRIAEAGVLPHAIRMHEKTVNYAYEELVRRHDLSEPLL